MANIHPINAQDLLEQILAAGRELAKDGKKATGDLTTKGKEIAAKGEDLLVDKLDIADTEVGRAALRKGMGAGAAAGALALLLTSRSGRKLAAIGGLSGLGVLAYKAYQNGEMPKSTDDVIGLITGSKADTRTDMLLRAMVSAAASDGRISDEEMSIIEAHDGNSVDTLEAALKQKPDAKAIAALADSDQAGREIYAVSCRIADGINPRERLYLDELAMALRLDPEVAAIIESNVRIG